MPCAECDKLRATIKEMMAERDRLRADLKRQEDKHDVEISDLAMREHRLRAMLEEAADTLEHCRYSEIPIAKKCRAVLAESETPAP